MAGEPFSDIITKEWNGFGFKFVTKSHYPAVLQQLQGSFYLDEPIHKILGVTPERSADMDRKISDIFDLNHGSFYAYPLDQPDKIVGVLIIWVHEKGQSLPPFEPRSPLTPKIGKFIGTFKSGYSIHDERNVDKYPELFIVATDRDYRGKGLATEMYRKAIAKFRAQGYPLVSSTFTNPLSRKLGDKLGFKPVNRMEFQDFKNPDGSLVFGEEGKQHFVVETVLDLK